VRSDRAESPVTAVFTLEGDIHIIAGECQYTPEPTEAEISGLKLELEASNSALERVKAEAAELAASLSASIEREAQLQSQLDITSSQSKVEISTLRSTLETTEAEMRREKMEISTLSSSLAACKTQAQGTESMLKSQLASIIAETGNEISSLREELEAAKSTLRKEQTEKHELLSEKASFDEKWNASLSEASKREASLKTQIASLTRVRVIHIHIYIYIHIHHIDVLLI
jgi:chromosome segregation ATPase